MNTEDATGDGRSLLWVDCYQELKELARSRLRQAGAVTLINTTALVHNSYLKLVSAQRIGPEPGSRRRFMSYASTVMRSVIVDLARERQAAKRGSDQITRLDTYALDRESAQDDDPLRVDEALQALRLREPRLAQVVEMRFFGGLTEAEIAEALEVSERTVREDWRKVWAIEPDRVNDDLTGLSPSHPSLVSSLVQPLRADVELHAIA
jgi:RNA polymerase sigma factor (TIGR02999 family)